MRRFTVQLMDELARREIGSLLPDLPGTGESEVELTRVGMRDWVAALRPVCATVTPSCSHIVGLGGGALLDGSDAERPCRRWHLSPDTGQRLVRDLDRSSFLGGTATIAWPLSRALRGELMATAPVIRGAVRTARLQSDPAPADVRLNGSPLWRRAEPGEDATLLLGVADDIAGWIER